MVVCDHGTVVMYVDYMVVVCVEIILWLYVTMVRWLCVAFGRWLCVDPFCDVYAISEGVRGFRKRRSLQDTHIRLTHTHTHTHTMPAV